MDAVITWVDGTDKIFRKKMQDFMGAESNLSEEMQYDERCVSGNEIVGCVASIKRYAPWIENIYIVTDEQDPIKKFPEISELGGGGLEL